MPTPDTNLSTEHQRPGDAARPSDTLDRDTAPTAAPEHTDSAKGSPAKGAHRMGDDGAADRGFATNGE